MSDFTAIILLLIATAMGGFTFMYVATQGAYKRTDDILSGVVNGVPVSLESRWLFFLHDYLGSSFGATFLTFILIAGFLGASELVSTSTARNIAYLCAGVAGWAFVFNLLLSVLWSRHFVRVLRQAEAD